VPPSPKQTAFASLSELAGNLRRPIGCGLPSFSPLRSPSTALARQRADPSEGEGSSADVASAHEALPARSPSACSGLDGAGSDVPAQMGAAHSGLSALMPLKFSRLTSLVAHEQSPSTSCPQA